jgi:GDP-L-fucose synthase
MMEINSKIYVAGHKGLVGSAILRFLLNKGYKNLVFRSHNELDLRDKVATRDFFLKEKPEYVFLAAAKVGGIKANMQSPVDFIYDNLAIQSNVIYYSWKVGAKKLLFLGSNCMYPKNCNQPMTEEDILTGPFEDTNSAYAIAKVAGMEMCKSFNIQYKTDFITAIPASIYGINDNFDSESSHFIPGLIRRFHEAKKGGLEEVIVWGTGTPRREVLFSDDVAEGLVFLMNNYSGSSPINVGYGSDFSVKEIAYLIKEVVGYNGKIIFDDSKPDGMMRKLIDSTKINGLGWRRKTNIKDGLSISYDFFKSKVLS